MTQHNPVDPAPVPTDNLLRSIQSRPPLAIGLGAGIIVLATLVAYMPAMRAGFVWDDDYYVTRNGLLQSWEGLQRIWFDVIPDPAAYPLPQYYPMTHTSFWLEYRFWGLDPQGYHIVNVLLHITNALLIWLILRKLAVPGAWLAAAIFALHPINVESVAWVAERKNVLCMMFFLSSVYVYLRYAKIIAGPPRPPAPAEGEAEQVQWMSLPDDPVRLYALALALFAAALLSKTITSSMPAVVLLIIWWKRRRILASDVLPLLPMFALGIAMGLLTAHMEMVRVGIALRPEPWIYSDSPIGQIAAKCIIAGRVFWFYIAKLIWPIPLIFNYPRWNIDPGRIALYLFPLLALAALAGLALNRRRLGTAPLVAALYFAGTLAPALGFFNVWPMQYSFVADHFVYLSCIGLIALAAAAGVTHLKPAVLAGVSAVVLLAMTGLTAMHARVFTEPKTLWEDTLKKTDSQSWFAMHNYGWYILDRSRRTANASLWDEAEKRFRRVIELKPDHGEARVSLGKIAEARAELVLALVEIATTRPTTAEASGPVPTTFTSTTQPQEYYQQALTWYRDAIQQEPNLVEAHFLLARRLGAAGQVDEATREFKKVVELSPRHVEGHDALGALAYQQRNLDEAILHFEKVVELTPNSPLALTKLGTALQEAGRVVEGLGQWEMAIRLDPGNPQWSNEYGARLAASGQYPQAVHYLRQALTIDPQSLEAMTNLGIVAAKTGHPDQAARLFENALKINPAFTKAQQSLDALKSGRLAPATTRASTLPAVNENDLIPQ